MEKADPNRLWYIFLQDKEIGPLKEVEIRHRILTGSLASITPAYTDGLSDWKALRELPLFKDLFEETAQQQEVVTEEKISAAFEKIPFSAKERKKKSDRARIFLLSSLALFVGAVAFYFWNPSFDAKMLATNNTPEIPIAAAEDDPFAKKDWAELRNYRGRTDIQGMGFVLARDHIDEDFPVLKGAVSTNVQAGEIDYRLYPVPGANLMPLPKVIEGRTSVVNGYFVVGPLSDGGAALPTGKYRLIARADQTFLGEVTLVRGNLPEGPQLQKEEEKLKILRFQKINDLRTNFLKHVVNLNSVLKEFETLKSGAVAPGATNPADFPSQARLALEKLRDERLAIKNSEADFVLMGPAGLDFSQVAENVWTTFSPSFNEFPNPDPQRFKSFDAKSAELKLSTIATLAGKVNSEEIAARSETMLNEEAIKKSLMNVEANAR